jgi:hypothetical protein
MNKSLVKSQNITQDNTKDSVCQYMEVDRIGFEDSAIRLKKTFKKVVIKSGIYFLLLKIEKFMAKKSLFDKKKIIHPSKDSYLSTCETDDLYSGDIVKIKEKEKISATLDGNNRLAGCEFFPEMWAFCGGQHKVFKKIEYFYDEASAKFRNSRNLYLLENVHCSGVRSRFWPICDKSCFLYWRREWLEKVK